MYFVMCLLIYIATGIIGVQASRGDDASFDKSVGQDFIYECHKNNNRSNDEVSIYIGNDNKYNVRRSLKIMILKMKVYEFDNEAQIECHGQKTNLMVSGSTQRRSYNPYRYSDESEIDFYCETFQILTDYSLHFVMVDKYDMVKNINSIFYNEEQPASRKIMTYRLPLSKKNDGDYLVCFYFNCNQSDIIYECTRTIVDEKSFIFEYVNDNGDETSSGISPYWIGIGVGIIVVIILFILIYFYTRRCHSQSQDNANNLQYADIERTHGGRNVQRKEEAVPYAMVTGCLKPGEK